MRLADARVSPLAQAAGCSVRAAAKSGVERLPCRFECLATSHHDRVTQPIPVGGRQRIAVGLCEHGDDASTDAHAAFDVVLVALRVGHQITPSRQCGGVDEWRQNRLVVEHERLCGRHQRHATHVNPGKGLLFLVFVEQTPVHFVFGDVVGEVDVLLYQLFAFERLVIVEVAGIAEQRARRQRQRTHQRNKCHDDRSNSANHGSSSDVFSGARRDETSL